MSILESKHTPFYKCIIWFLDGNIRTFYSYDKTHNAAKPSETLGIKRLNKMITGKFAGTYKTAIIYKNAYKGDIIAKYVNGLRLEIQ